MQIKISQRIFRGILNRFIIGIKAPPRTKIGIWSSTTAILAVVPANCFLSE